MFTWHVEMHAPQVKPGRGERNTRIQFAPKDQRNIVTENVSKDPAEHTGDHAADRCHQHALPHLQCRHATNQGEGDQAQGIEHQEQ
ncbi:hypothetical protein D3C77_733780 [compost metagenome]